MNSPTPTAEHLRSHRLCKARDARDRTRAVAGDGRAEPVHQQDFSPAKHRPGNVAKAGPSEEIVSRARTSPYLAAMVNAAAMHVAEQDDVHDGLVFHPATVVFPATMVTAQILGASVEQLLAAAVADYQVGIRVGEFLGRSHYKVFNTAYAAAAELMLAYLAKDGFTSAAQILEDQQGMAAGMPSGADPARLTDGLGTCWATAQTSSKYHASCRYRHPVADALLQVMQVHALKPEDLDRVITQVHQGAIDVLGSVLRPDTVHQSKFSMGTELVLVARFGQSGLAEFDRHFLADSTQSLAGYVSIALDAEVDAAYPRRWIGKVTVHILDGRVLHGRVDEPKGDPGNTLSREEITVKALRLAAFSGGATADEMLTSVNALWHIASVPVVGDLLQHHQKEPVHG
jgi:2-methylcitrate dehydratase PrpD